MAKEKLLTVREVAAYFRISEKAVLDLSNEGVIPAYKIGGMYLRFKEEQVKNIKIPDKVLSTAQMSTAQDSNLNDKDSSGYRSPIERINDFLYFNDFYFLCFLICLILLFVVFYT